MDKKKTPETVRKEWEQSLNKMDSQSAVSDATNLALAQQAIEKAKSDPPIELKVSKGYDGVIGQTLRYMAWISKHLADPGQAVRGVIAARDISEDLRLACSYLPNVLLYEYELSVVLRKVAIEPVVSA